MGPGLKQYYKGQIQVMGQQMAKTMWATLASVMGFFFFFLEKYILAPETTTLSPDGTPNYQHLHSDPQNYHFMIFWPHPSVYTVNSNKNWPKTRKYLSLNRENFKV
jgi:hypothetical protein